MYKLELHCHTREVSACSDYPARREIEIYRQAGYSGTETETRIRDNAALLKTLRSGNYRLIRSL